MYVGERSKRQRKRKKINIQRKRKVDGRETNTKTQNDTRHKRVSGQAIDMRSIYVMTTFLGPLAGVLLVNRILASLIHTFQIHLSEVVSQRCL